MTEAELLHTIMSITLTSADGSPPLRVHKAEIIERTFGGVMVGYDSLIPPEVIESTLRPIKPTGVRVLLRQKKHPVHAHVVVNGMEVGTSPRVRPDLEGYDTVTYGFTPKAPVNFITIKAKVEEVIIK